MFPWTKLSQRLAEQQNAIEALRKRCLALEEARKTDKESSDKQIRELRRASIEESFAWGGSGILSRLYGVNDDTKPYTAMDAVRLLLDRSGLKISTDPSKGPQHKLVPVKRAKKPSR